ncbi:hypothetical protein FLA_1794 [Filimonas lacunae]|nr:hypothetical protein FLA_1794 [Filimonas lacunae]
MFCIRKTAAFITVKIIPAQQSLPPPLYNSKTIIFFKIINHLLT